MSSTFTKPGSVNLLRGLGIVSSPVNRLGGLGFYRADGAECRMISLTSGRKHITHMLCFAIGEILAYIFILLGSLVALLDGKALKETVARRERLEQGMSNLPAIRDDWRQWGLPFPNSMEQVKAELAKTVRRENDLRRQRKILAVILLVVGTLLLILSKLPALGINLSGVPSKVFAMLTFQCP